MSHYSPIHCFLPWLLAFSVLPSAFAVRIPAHIFPNEKSTVITQIDIPESEIDHYPKVLDPTLDDSWYWTTHTGEFTGYVNRRDIDGKTRLKRGTIIRVNPTYSSWVLTKYEPNDDVRVRSRLSVGRVSIKKEIPVYFQLKQTKDTPQVNVFAESTVRPAEETPPLPVEPAPIVKAEPQPIQPMYQEPISTPIIETQHLIEAMEAPEIAIIPELTDEPTQEIIDPLLEEKPRISPQALVDLAPPPVDLFQEFEGYLRLVAQDDAQVEQFQYQLDTRSGRRIVYVETSQLVGDSFETYVDQWINIRGSLEETQPNFALFIEAKNIWVAP